MEFSLTRQDRTDPLSKKEMHIYCKGANNKFTFIPMPGFKSKFFGIIVPFGSFMRHMPTTSEKILDLPAGTAHLLEHLIFSRDNSLKNYGTSSQCDPLEELEKSGAELNAYTSHDHTLFYIQSVDNFYESALNLLKTVLSFNTDAIRLENERKVIMQEILLDLENPEEKVYNDIMHNLFSAHPIRDDIAGTKDTLDLIDEEIVNEAYHYYYSPERLNFVVVGDIDETLFLEQTLAELYPTQYIFNNDKDLLYCDNSNGLEKEIEIDSLDQELDAGAFSKFENEQVLSSEFEDKNYGKVIADNINNKLPQFIGALDYPICHIEEDRGSISKVIKVDSEEDFYCIAYRDSYFGQDRRIYGLDIERRKLAAEVVLGILFGSSSKFYEQANREALIDDSYFWQYVCYGDIAYFCLGSYTSDPELLSKSVKEVIEKSLMSDSISIDDFNRRKKMIIGNYIQEQDSIQELGFLMAGFNTKQMDGFHYSSLSRNLCMDDGVSILNDLFNESKCVEIIAESSRND